MTSRKRPRYSYFGFCDKPENNSNITGAPASDAQFDNSIIYDSLELKSKITGQTYLSANVDNNTFSSTLDTNLSNVTGLNFKPNVPIEVTGNLILDGTLSNGVNTYTLPTGNGKLALESETVLPNLPTGQIYIGNNGVPVSSTAITIDGSSVNVNGSVKVSGDLQQGTNTFHLPNLPTGQTSGTLALNSDIGYLPNLPTGQIYVGNNGVPVSSNAITMDSTTLNSNVNINCPDSSILPSLLQTGNIGCARLYLNSRKRYEVGNYYTVSRVIDVATQEIPARNNDGEETDSLALLYITPNFNPQIVTIPFCFSYHSGTPVTIQGIISFIIQDYTRSIMITAHIQCCATSNVNDKTTTFSDEYCTINRYVDGNWRNGDDALMKRNIGSTWVNFHFAEIGDYNPNGNAIILQIQNNTSSYLSIIGKAEIFISLDSPNSNS